MSQALRLLRAFGVVTGRREGRNVVTLGAALVATPLGTRKDTTGRRTFGSYRAEVFPVCSPQEPAERRAIPT